ncbi:hypothetical protein [Sphingomonas sp. 37zxx]|uniref:hypothetical protein n=1 Tax=Sphingomonas sp. 37zxx TaxID=1550073 RepID=UPI00053C017C|nr:hypothetical protein [Sphingomonas sp. 37zxx]
MAQWMILAAAAALPAISAPAMAQVQNGTLVIFGNDRCPTNADGEEIVVCVRKGEAERFRIPQELRELEITPENRAWAVRSEDTLRAGDSGIGSCSAVGIGGMIGCAGQAADTNRAVRRERRQAEQAIPLP